MRPKLLQSFVLVTAFWFVATTVYWSFSEPAINLQALRALKGLVPFLPFALPAEADILMSLAVQIKVLTYWSLPVLLATALSFVLGYAAVWAKAKRTALERDVREEGTGEYRGVTLTVGVLPMPEEFPRDEVELGDDPDGLLGKMTEKERTLLEQVFGTLSAHPNAYAGPGIGSSLVEHAMAVAQKALETHRAHPGLAACAAAGHELSKLTSYRKDAKTGEWGLVKDEDREASRILASLPGWWLLPSDARTALHLAVRFKSNPRLMPEIESDVSTFKLAQDLLYSAKDVRSEIVHQEQQKTLEKHELPDVVLDAFKKALPMLAFQSRGLPKGVRAVAWKVGRRVYLLEIALRESVTAQLPPEVAAALQPSEKVRSRVQPFTAELLKALELKKWLVTEIDDKKLNPAEALWTVQAGKLEFRGVIIIDVPDEFMGALPPQDSMYEVSVTGVLFTHALKDTSTPGIDKATKSALSGVLDM